MKQVIRPQVQSPHSRYIAMDKDNRVIAEGRTIKSVYNKAERTGRPFIMAYIPELGKKYLARNRISGPYTVPTFI